MVQKKAIDTFKLEHNGYKMLIKYSCWEQACKKIFPPKTIEQTSLL